MMLNLSIVSGYLGKDIQLHHTPNNVPYCVFNLAVRSKFKNQKGEYETDWIKCKAWKHNAVYLSGFKKGDFIEVEGRLKPEEYEKEGVKIGSQPVIVERVKGIHSPAKSDRPNNSSPQPPTGYQGDAITLPDDDLPF